MFDMVIYVIKWYQITHEKYSKGILDQIYLLDVSEYLIRLSLIYIESFA